MARITLRGGSGLGDSLYVQSIARHFADQGRQVEVCTFWPDVFLPIKDRVDTIDFRKDNVNCVAHYVARKDAHGTDMFQDCCISAGLGRDEVDLRLDWTPQNRPLIETVRRRKPAIAVLLPRLPMARKDGFGMDLLPDCNAIQKAIDRLKSKGAFIVQLGAGDAIQQFSGIDLDLANRTSITDLIDVGSAVDGFLGYCSFFVPLAESFSKPALFVWSRRGLSSDKKFLRTVTPAKVLHRSSSKAVFDDCSDEELNEATNALLAAARTPAVL